MFKEMSRFDKLAAIVGCCVFAVSFWISIYNQNIIGIITGGVCMIVIVCILAFVMLRHN